MNFYGVRELLDGMRSVRRNTIRIAEDIPESDYGYRPTPESRSVGETLVHIAMLGRGDRFLHGDTRRPSLELSDIDELISGSASEEKRLRSKAEILDLLRTEGESWTRWVEDISEGLLSEPLRQPGGASSSRFEMLLGTKEHEIHHRAQLTVIERLLGIVPHFTRNRPAAREVGEKSS